MAEVEGAGEPPRMKVAVVEFLLEVAAEVESWPLEPEAVAGSPSVEEELAFLSVHLAKQQIEYEV